MQGHLFHTRGLKSLSPGVFLTVLWAKLPQCALKQASSSRNRKLSAAITEATLLP